MRTVPGWIVFTILRVLLFAIPLAVTLSLGVEPWIAALSAAVIGLCLSTIVLVRPRTSFATMLYNTRHRTTSRAHRDNELEDAAIASASSTAASAPADESESEGGAKNHRVEETGTARQF